MFEMFGYPEYSLSGEKVLTTREGLYKNMMMDIRVFKMNPGKSQTFYSQDDEMAVLIINGYLEIIWEGQSMQMHRLNCFDHGAYCLHVCRGTQVQVTAMEESEILIQSTDNSNTFVSRFFSPNDCTESVSGLELCENTAVRLVRTIFDYTTAPYSNMVMGEVISRQGSWSSYIPHSHPQPEVYYYHFEKSQGFGGCFIGKDVFRIRDGSFCAIPGGLTHPQVTAPGYRMYTCWMIRHLDGNPWTERIDDPEHIWMLPEVR